MEQSLKLGLTELGGWRILVSGSYGILWFGLVSTKDTGSRLSTQDSGYYPESSMPLQRASVHDVYPPCTWQDPSVCQVCQANGKLMCRLDKKDMASFFMIILPFGVTSISGAIRAGYAWCLLLWLAYSLLFFFVWEARVLCRHCPYWAEAGSILRCHANYGVIKIWKYQPGPMSKAEKVQFALGAMLWIAFPFPFLLLGQEYLLAVIGMSAAMSGAFLLRRYVCSRCINFSCPMNTVPKQLVDAYLGRNPQIQAAWEARAYRLGK